MARKGKRVHKSTDISTTVTGERMLPFAATCAITSWSRPSIYRLIERGLFPRPVKLGEHRVAFRETDIANYLASRQSR